jgi:hypothetical protein
LGKCCSHSAAIEVVRDGSEVGCDKVGTKLTDILGAVYTCDSAYKSPFNSVYDFLHKVVCNITFNRFFLICAVVIGVQRIF